MGNLMPLPVSSRSRSVVLRGRRESERGRQTRPQLLLLLFEQKTAQQTHRTSLTPRSRAHVADATVCLGFFSVVCLGFFFEFWKKFNTTENKRQTIQLQKQRVCAVSSAPQHTDQVSHLPVGTESAALSVAVAGLGEKIRESTRRGEKVI